MIVRWLLPAAAQRNEEARGQDEREERRSCQSPNHSHGERAPDSRHGGTHVGILEVRGDGDDSLLILASLVDGARALAAEPVPACCSYISGYVERSD